MKKILAFLLVCVLALTLALPAFGAAAPARDLPIITVPGTSNTHILNAGGETIVPDSFDLKTFIAEDPAFGELLRSFALATLTNRWDAYCDRLVEALTPIWAPAVYDKTGSPQHGDTPTWSWTPESVPKKTSGFREGDYYFRYDWRMDPLETAAQLDAYIDAVLLATGAAKVALVGRCYGACVLQAYLATYGCDKIDTAIYYMPMVTGVETEEALFTGEISLDAATVENYARYWLNCDRPVADDDLTEMLSAAVTLFYYSGGLTATAWTLERWVGKFKDNILPRLLRVSYGTYPGYWAMIGDAAYEKAKAYVFGGYEAEYAGLTEKTDRYHETVQTPMFGLLDALQAEGMKVNVIAKYGVPTYPYFAGSDYLTDSSNSLTRQSFGATASRIHDTLSPAYLEARRAAGFGGYLSVDGKIDASTCRYPAQTWFFKDVKHLDMDPTVSELMTLCAQVQTQLTVTDDPRFPQFMHKTADGEVEPLPENDPSDAKWTRPGFFEALRQLFRAAFRFLRATVKKSTAKAGA